MSDDEKDDLKRYGELLEQDLEHEQLTIRNTLIDGKVIDDNV